jgi:hypothetical protein
VSIRADVEGLSALAACCFEQAAAVSGVNAAPPVGGSFQPTGAAVAAVHTDVAAAASRFAARLNSTGDDVTITGHEFALTETNSTSNVSAVAATEV